MPVFSFKRVVYILAFLWVLFLFGNSLYSPPTFNSDPGLGFLDLIHFSKGGSFQHHLTPAMEDANTCIEERTSWWTPGQWFFVYLFMLTGMSMGTAISITVLAAIVAGWLGWRQLYRRFGFDEQVVLITGLLILLSRYCYTSFQIYPGATILEFAFAPWFLLLWLSLEARSIYLQALVLFPLLLVSYFLKSSMLIFWLGVITSNVSPLRLREAKWSRLVIFLLVFVAGKYCCDLLFTKGGLTPFSYATEWMSIARGQTTVQLQYMLFLLQGSFLAGPGIDDYIKYVFQQPGKVIFTDGHPVLLILYGVLLFLFLLVVRFVWLSNTRFQKRYVDVFIGVTGVFTAFFVYAFFSGKNINAYEESRHFRLAGLIVLPATIQWLLLWMKRWLYAIPLLLFLYAVPSYMSKVKRPKVLSNHYHVPVSFQSHDDYQQFVAAAKSADLVYVTNSVDKYELDHCKTIYNQDDFTSTEVIRARPKSSIHNKKMIFLLPAHFAKNGKREAILANFIPFTGTRVHVSTIQELDGHELITVQFY